MSITPKNFTAKKSSVSYLLSILLSATALTAPLTLVAPSFGMDAPTPTTSSEISRRMLDVLEAEVSKNPSLQFKEIQPSTFSKTDNTVTKSSTFNLGHQQNAIYAVMSQLGQAADFNAFQALALQENDPDNQFLIKVTDKIRRDNEFVAQIILNGTERLKPLDIAQRGFLTHALTNLSIVSQAYREVFSFTKKNLEAEYEKEKNICNDEIETLEDTVNLEKQKIENESSAIEQKIAKDIESNKALLSPDSTQADRNTLNGMIQELETKRRKNFTDRSKNINAQTKIVLDKKAEVNGKLTAMQTAHNKIISEYRTKLSFIFEGKGTGWIPGKKTLERYWNSQPTTRAEFNYYQDMDGILHSNENLMQIARAKFFYTLFKDFKDTTPNQIKKEALESLLGFTKADRDVIHRLFNVVMESSSPQIAPLKAHKADSQPRLKVGIPASKTSGSEKISPEEAKELTISREVANVTDQVAVVVISETPKKKIEGIEESEETITLPFNPKMTSAPAQKPQTYEIVGPKATILVSASTDQKKNESKPIRYGRNNKRR